MGTENFLVGLSMTPEVIKSILGCIFDMYLAGFEGFVGEASASVQMVETADDIAAQNSLLLSPESYRQFIKPLEEKLYSRIHDLTPQSRPDLFHGGVQAGGAARRKQPAAPSVDSLVQSLSPGDDHADRALRLRAICVIVTKWPVRGCPSPRSESHSR